MICGAILCIKRRSQHAPEVQRRIADLSGQIAAVQEELETITRGPLGLQVILPELHDADSGRVDAQKMADYMSVPLKQLAQGLKLNYKAVHRHPSAPSFQPALRPVKRSLEILRNSSKNRQPFEHASIHRTQTSITAQPWTRYWQAIPTRF